MILGTTIPYQLSLLLLKFQKNLLLLSWVCIWRIISCYVHDLQGAYRHGRSADQVLSFAVDTIMQVVDHGDYICTAFLDMRKAFDSLDHHLLLRRLSDLGVQWFVDYLSNRKQCVKKWNQYSDWGAVLGVIPQGSALGPLLFVNYMTSYCKCHMAAYSNLLMIHSWFVLEILWMLLFKCYRGLRWGEILRNLV